MKVSGTLAGLIQSFFTDRLIRQRQASPHTIAGYRDTFRLLFRFAQRQLKKPPSALSLEDLDAPFLGAFLDHLETERGNRPRSRNTRLAAIRSFFRYAAFSQPEHAALIQRVLAMPAKRDERKPIDFLTHDEVDALLRAPDQSTRHGRRDRTLLLLAVQTGLRVSELTALRIADLALGDGPHVRCLGKGRKERCTPLRRDAVAALKNWLCERRARPSDPLFPSAKGGALSRDAVERLLAKHVTIARRRCSSLEHKHVSPHVLRHSAAMDLLQHGVDRSVIALWLGHESVETTQMYLQASLEMKERALAKTAPVNTPAGRYRPDDQLLDFLRGL